MPSILTIVLLSVLSISTVFGTVNSEEREAQLLAEHEYHVAAMAERYQEAMNSCERTNGSQTLTQPSPNSDSELECIDYKCASGIDDLFVTDGWKTVCRVRQSAGVSTSELSCNISSSNPRAVDCSDGKTYQLDAGSVSNSSIDEILRDLATSESSSSSGSSRD